MITVNNKQFRNLEEQVQKNKEDIAAHYEVDRVLNVWGLRVLGILNTPSDIPDMEYQYGDAYGIHSGDDIVYYVWTRENPNIGQYEDYWLNIGPIALQGPQGLRGPIGPAGPAGVRGSIASSSSTPPMNARTGDLWINPTNGNFYIYTEQNTWQYTMNLRGPQGYIGQVGPKGDTGLQGPRGPQGNTGKAGTLYSIAGYLSSTDLLPTPTEETKSNAYAVGTQGNYNLYIAAPDTELGYVWLNAGPISAVEGPQGPIGPQGITGDGPITVIIADSTLKEGYLSTEDVNKLTTNRYAMIYLNNEMYYAADIRDAETEWIYTHSGKSLTGGIYLKFITLDVSTGHWSLSETYLGESTTNLLDIETLTLVNTATSDNHQSFTYQLNDDIPKTLDFWKNTLLIHKGQIYSISTDDDLVSHWQGTEEEAAEEGVYYYFYANFYPTSIPINKIDQEIAYQPNVMYVYLYTDWGREDDSAEYKNFIEVHIEQRNFQTTKIESNNRYIPQNVHINKSGNTILQVPFSESLNILPSPLRDKILAATSAPSNHDYWHFAIDLSSAETASLNTSIDNYWLNNYNRTFRWNNTPQLITTPTTDSILAQEPGLMNNLYCSGQWVSLGFYKPSETSIASSAVAQSRQALGVITTSDVWSYKIQNKRYFLYSIKLITPLYYEGIKIDAISYWYDFSTNTIYQVDFTTSQRLEDDQLSSLKTEGYIMYVSACGNPYWYTPTE